MTLAASPLLCACVRACFVFQYTTSLNYENKGLMIKLNCQKIFKTQHFISDIPLEFALVHRCNHTYTEKQTHKHKYIMLFFILRQGFRPFPRCPPLQVQGLIDPETLDPEVAQQCGDYLVFQASFQIPTNPPRKLICI